LGGAALLVLPSRRETRCVGGAGPAGRREPPQPVEEEPPPSIGCVAQVRHRGRRGAVAGPQVNGFLLFAARQRPAFFATAAAARAVVVGGSSVGQPLLLQPVGPRTEEDAAQAHTYA
jgi:hypothetical protein